jgi:hypothetical protein
MAVYQGARRRPFGLPGLPGLPGLVRAPELPRLRSDAPAIPRRRIRAAVRARRAPSRISLILGAIVVAFVCAFFSLAQSIRVSELRYEADRLAAGRGRLELLSQELQNDLNRWAKAPAVRKQAIDAGLGPLSEPLIVPAR